MLRCFVQRVDATRRQPASPYRTAAAAPLGRSKRAAYYQQSQLDAFGIRVWLGPNNRLLPFSVKRCLYDGIFIVLSTAKCPFSVYSRFRALLNQVLEVLDSRSSAVSSLCLDVFKHVPDTRFSRYTLDVFRSCTVSRRRRKR